MDLIFTVLLIEQLARKSNKELLTRKPLAVLFRGVAMKPGPKPKLTEAQVAALRRSPLTPKALAADFGISLSHVYNLLAQKPKSTPCPSSP